MFAYSLLDFLAHGLLHASLMQIVMFTLIATHITIVSVTIYLHRCQAHRALELHPIASHFFRFWLWLTTGMVTREWTAIHRKHHAKCETEEDPHSPQRRGIWTVLLKGAELYRIESKNAETLREFGRGTPDDWLERHLYAKYSFLGITLLMVIDVALFGVIGFTVWAVQMLWVPFWAAGVVNGLAHYWGYRNFNCPDASANVFPLGILIGGEELHNNHHTFVTSAKFSVKWYEFDIGWFYLRVLCALRLAKIKRVAPKPKLDRHKSAPDFETLHAILLNRYEVMARYAKTFKRTYRQELARIKALDTKEKYLLIKSARQWLHAENTRLPMSHQTKLLQVFVHSHALQLFYELRDELNALWTRSNASREQLLQQLQHWCHRAEHSGIQALQEFAGRLRCYT